MAGSGPSLTRDDLELCRHAGAKLLVLNDAWLLAPMANVLYAADGTWWKSTHEAGVTDCRLPPMKFTLHPYMHEVWPTPTVVSLLYAGKSGLSEDPTCIFSGGHSGYQAINVAYHLVGPRSRIILLGCDMQVGRNGRHHAAGLPERGHNLKYDVWRPIYASLIAPLAAKSVEIVNASRRTALTCFPCVPLEQALAR